MKKRFIFREMIPYFFLLLTIIGIFAPNTFRDIQNYAEQGFSWVQEQIEYVTDKYNPEEVEDGQNIIQIR